MPVSPDVLELGDQMIGLRREFHQHPELAWQERRTAGRVAEILGQTPLALRLEVARTGLVAETPPVTGRRVMLRVDLDGLPIQEENDVPYRSRVAGAMHACGHDGHTAMGVTAARVLSRRSLPGQVRLLFQPAEEGEGGAQAAVADGVMDGVDMVLGVHLWNELPVGTLGVKSGPLMAAVDRLRIVIEGRGGHGAQPHRAHDPVVAAAHVVIALQTLVSREISPVQPAVLTIGSIHGGEAFNVIPPEVTLLGTLRSFDPAVRASLPARIHRIATGVAEGLGCRARVEVKPGNPAVINHPDATEVARRAAVAVVGEARVVEPEPTMGGEDMAVYFGHAPGCFVFVGSANPAKGLTEPHHNPRFDFDEDALVVGADFLVRAAEEALRA